MTVPRQRPRCRARQDAQRILPRTIQQRGLPAPGTPERTVTGRRIFDMFGSNSWAADHRT